MEFVWVPVAWIKDNSGRKTHVVGGKQANGPGLYDMTGNVGEWCRDVYSSGAYSGHARKNPLYDKEAGQWTERVHRGGDWGSRLKDARLTYRMGNAPESAYSTVGVRLVWVAD